MYYDSLATRFLEKTSVKLAYLGGMEVKTSSAFSKAIWVLWKKWISESVKLIEAICICKASFSESRAATVKSFFLISLI